jgi:hypothetical protein
MSSRPSYAAWLRAARHSCAGLARGGLLLAALLVPAAGGAPAAAYTAVAVADGEESYGFCHDRPSEGDAAACAVKACQRYAADAAGCAVTFEHFERGFYAWARGAEGGAVGYSFHGPEEAAALALAACGQRTGACAVLDRWAEALGDRAEFTGPRPPLTIAAPRQTVVLIYTHGSVGEFEPDPCRLERQDVPFGMPSAIAVLDGRRLWGKLLRVDGFCTPSKVGQFDTASGRPRRLKVELRKEDLRERVLAYRAQGVPARQIFLAGHSAGAWAALMLEAEEPTLFNAVVAIAPAFAGRRQDQDALWLRVRQNEFDQLLSAPKLDGLLFAFEGDPYETPATLQALASRWDLAFVAVAESARRQRGCSAEPHQTALDSCFAAGWSGAIGDWLAAKLR